LHHWCVYTLLTVLSHVTVAIVIFFFFEAEDGIRDKLVTGVQTCALPIWDQGGQAHGQASGIGHRQAVDVLVRVRSEERRVGKECRSRWAPYHSKTQQ